MKKIVTIVAVLLLVACLACLLVACNHEGMDFEDAEITVTNFSPAKLATSDMVSEVSALEGLTFVKKNNANTLLLFKKVVNEKERFTLYNIVTDTILVSDSNNSFTLYSYGENSFYTRSALDTMGDYRTSLYDANGNVISFYDSYGTEQYTYVSSAIPTVEHLTLDVFSFANNYYRVDHDKDAIKRIRTKAPLSDYNYYFYKNYTDDYYYQIESSRVLVFNKNLQLVTTYYPQGSYDDITISVLADGNLLVQTVLGLMDEDKNYTYISDGRKYEMKTYIYDVEDKDAVEKEFNYLIVSSDPAKMSEQDFKLNADNIAVLYPIEDERLLDGNNDKMVVSLSNKLRIQGRLDKMIDNQVPGTTFTTLNEYLVYTTSEGNTLVKSDGTVIGTVNNLNKNKRNDTFFAVGGKIYNYNLDFLYDFDANGYSDVLWMNNSLILAKVVDDKTVYFRYDTSMVSPTQITMSSTNFVGLFGSKYVYSIAGTVDEKTVYTYYNDGGEMINGFPTSCSMGCIAVNDEKAFYLYYGHVHDDVTDTDVVRYYRLA